MATLTGCDITFHTNDDDKDHDTHLTVEVADTSNVLCARIDNDFGLFDDQSDSGPFGLQVVNASSKDDCQRGSVRVRIDPIGKDEWHFDFNLILIFDDGTSLAGGAAGLRLDQNCRELTLGLQEILR